MDPLNQNQPPLRSEFAGDANMAELIEYYVSELPEKIKSISESLATNELEEVRRLAHQMKGASGGYGFTPLGDVAAKIEQAIDTDTELEQIKNSVDELIALCRRVSI